MAFAVSFATSDAYFLRLLFALSLSLSLSTFFVFRALQTQFLLIKMIPQKKNPSFGFILEIVISPLPFHPINGGPSSLFLIFLII